MNPVRRKRDLEDILGVQQPYWDERRTAKALYAIFVALCLGLIVGYLSYVEHRNHRAFERNARMLETSEQR